MNGILFIVNMYHVLHIRSCPKTLVLFGDNVLHTGKGGQAAQCRNEPNCLGVPTKWAPSTSLEAYFDDDDIGKVAFMVRDPFIIAKERLEEGRSVAYPMMGVGSGLSQLEWKAPRIHALVLDGEKLLRATASKIIQVTNLVGVDAYAEEHHGI